MPPTKVDGQGTRTDMGKTQTDRTRKRDRDARIQRVSCEIGEDLDVCEFCCEPMSVGDAPRKCPAKTNPLKQSLKKKLLMYDI